MKFKEAGRTGGPTVDQGEVTDAPSSPLVPTYMLLDACTRRNDNDEHGAPSPILGSFLTLV